MKVIINFIKFYFLVVAFATGRKVDAASKYKYECGTKYYRYNLDNEPAKYGLSAGDYEPGKKAYVGISNFENLIYHVNQIQLNPPGFVLYYKAGPAIFSNDSQKIWYLYNNPNHKYEWVDQKNSEIPPFALTVGEDQIGYKLLIGRVKTPNGLVQIGTVIVPNSMTMNYADENGISRIISNGFQVLTCTSSVKNEVKYPAPYEFSINKDDENGCIHNWQPYNNDDAPAINGISAGIYDLDNNVYVGKTKETGYFNPGGIVIYPKSGIFIGNNVVVSNSSYYLVDNPNYSYYWIPIRLNTLYELNNVHIFPNNTVWVRNDVGPWRTVFGRVIYNGLAKIGKVAYPAVTVNDDERTTMLSDCEILVCDPWPKYECAQQWKKLDFNDLNLLDDGFSVDSTTFIGRSTRKYINGYDYFLGKIQADSNGVNFLDDLSNVEYLVENSSYIYKWQTSRNGVKVINALELQKGAQRPFYIGMTRMNDIAVVGKVSPGEGLYFIDPVTGKQKLTNSYDVLTCTSPDASNREDNAESNTNWVGIFR